LRQWKCHELAGEPGHRDANLVGGVGRQLKNTNRSQPKMKNFYANSHTLFRPGSNAWEVYLE
jgi:hypothetical protein